MDFKASVDSILKVVEQNTNTISWIILGAVAGWIASIITESNHGLIEDIVLGIVGAFIGGYVMNYFGQQGITGFDVYSLVVAVVGATILIIIGRVFHK